MLQTHDQLLETLRHLEHSFGACGEYLQTEQQTSADSASDLASAENARAATQVLWVGSSMLQGLLQQRLAQFSQLERRLRSSAIGQGPNAAHTLRNMHHQVAEMVDWEDSLKKLEPSGTAEAHLSVLVTCTQHMDALVANYEKIIQELC